MNSKQLILLGFGVGMVALLFALPRTVLKKNEATNEISTKTEEINHSETGHSAFSKKTEQEVSELKSSLKKELKEEWLFDLVVAYNNAFSYDSASKYAEQLLKNYPSDKNKIVLAEVLYEKFLNALSEQEATNYAEKTRELFLQVKKPLNNNQKSKLAMTYTTTSTPMKGISMLREVVEQEPNHELATYNLGLLSLKSGQFDKAKERFLTLRKTYPNNLTYSYYLGICYAQLADNKSAIVEFQKIANLAKDPVLKSSSEKMLEQLK
ncbi:MAG: tetratricopeptide repeat protein [Cytophagales bacterium]